MTEQKWTMARIRKANKDAGQFWFSQGTMRFFRSQVENTIYQGPGGVFFISSEQFVPSDGSVCPRRYTVRRFNPLTADIRTVREFDEMSKEQTIELAKRCAAGNPVPNNK